MSDTDRIAAVFARLKNEDRMAFMPFVAFGDPDSDTSLAVIRELSARGAALIEVGFPYSDPIADGPVIQASYTRALANGLHVDDILGGITRLTSQAARGDRLPPLVAMVAYAIIFRRQPTAFVGSLVEAGFSGLIVPDLPGDEAGELAGIADDAGLDLIQLVSPTTPADRLVRILWAARGFVYCISITGTTGVRDRLPADLERQLSELRSKTELPLAVGFGISKPEQVRALRGQSDGVIVGSAMVRLLEPLSEGAASREEVVAKIGEFAAKMIAATNPP